MNAKNWYVAVIFSLVVGSAIGFYLGRDFSSEAFYSKCQGGKVFMEDKSGASLEVVGCAEIARRIRHEAFK